MTIWALLAVLLFPGGQPSIEPLRPAPAYVAPVQVIPLPLVIEEDDPRWDCRTMGNRVCGDDILDSWEWGPAPR